MGASQAPKHAVDAAQSGQAKDLSSCKVKQKKPLYVGFAKGMRLDNFEASAIMARDIVREVKHWACEDDVENASVAVPSLQLAFARSELIRLELVQFDAATLDRAHVLLSEGSDTPSWRVDLTERDSSWAVTQTRHATAEDIAEEVASRRTK